MRKSFDSSQCLVLSGAVLLSLLWVVIVQYPVFLSDGVYFLHDSEHVFEVFNITYANLFETGSFPEWMPYGFYGVPAYLRTLIDISPLSVLVMAFGVVSGVKDGLFLFRTVLLLECLTFLSGLALLGQTLWPGEKIAALLVALGILGSPFLINFQLELRIIYLLPLTLVLLIHFARTFRLTSFGLAALLMFSSGLGEPIYWIPMYAVLFVTLAVACLWGFGLPALSPRKVAPNPGLLAAVFFLGVCLFAPSALLMFGSIKHLSFATVGRDPHTLVVSLSNFLDYGGGGVVKVLELLLALPFGGSDVHLFIPVPILLSALMALLLCRSRPVLAMAGLMLFWTLVCWGRFGLIASLLFYLPGMQYFRHLGLLYAIPRLFLWILAVDGARHLWDLARTGEPGARPPRFFGIFALLCGSFGLLLVGGTYLLTQDIFQFSARKASFLLLALGGHLAIGLWLVFRVRRWAAVPAVFLVTTLVQAAWFVLLANSFQTRLKSWTAEETAELRNVRLYPFQETRPTIKAAPREDLWQKLGHPNTTTYMERLAFLGIDPCYPVTRLDYAMPGVVDFVAGFAPSARSKFAVLENLRDSVSNGQSEALSARLGCLGYPKVRLIRDWSFAGTGDPSYAEITDPDAGAISSITSSQDPFESRQTLREQGLAVASFSYNTLVLNLRERVLKPSWLYYADAAHPDWKVEIDGKEAQMAIFNGAFKGVLVPPGAREIRFDFNHTEYQICFWAMMLSALLVLLCSSIAGFRLAFFHHNWEPAH